MVQPRDATITAARELVVCLRNDEETYSADTIEALIALLDAARQEGECDGCPGLRPEDDLDPSLRCCRLERRTPAGEVKSPSRVQQVARELSDAIRICKQNALSGSPDERQAWTGMATRLRDIIHDPQPVGEMDAHCPTCGAGAETVHACKCSPTPARAVEVWAPRHHHRHPWAQPGDAPNRIWIMRFDDADVREMIWTDEDAERDAKEAYERYSRAWNVYLFAAVPAALSALPFRGEGGAHTTGFAQAAAELRPAETTGHWTDVWDNHGRAQDEGGGA